MRISDWSSDVCSSDLLDLGGGQAFGALIEDEAADAAAMRVGFGPDDEHVGDRRVADPRLRARQRIAAVDLPGAGLHAAGVRSGIGLGEAEAADPEIGRA